MEAEIEAMNDAEDRSFKAAQEALLHRPLEQRTLHVPKPPNSSRKHEVEVVAGGYLCCT
jgi:hypothetical protein